MILSANYLVLVDCMTDMWLVVYTSENFGTFVNLQNIGNNVNKETNHEYKMKNKALYYLPELDNGTDGECRHSDHL